MATLRQQFATNVLTVTRFRELMRRMRANRPNDDLELIRKAYEFSQKHHAGQSRASGQPYLVHPLEVALVLAEMKMDPVAIAAGLLHDSVEDTSVTVVDIRKELASRSRTSSRVSPKSAPSISPPARSSRPKICAR